MKISLIAAVDANNGIGYGNDLLFKLSKDMKHFVKMTKGHIVLMGRKTFESMGSKSLPNRTNIVISTTMQPGFDSELDVFVYPNVHMAKDALHASFHKDEEAFVIGGAAIYQEMLDYASVIYLTRIQATKKADTFFPNVGSLVEWEMVNESEVETEIGIDFTFCRYERKDL